MKLNLLEPVGLPILHPDHTDCRNTRFGFEGGTVHRFGGFTYLFTTENYAEPKTCQVRLSSWKSSDGINFSRMTTLRDVEGTIGERGSFNCGWSPNLIFSEDENRWICHYVSYSHKGGGADIYNLFGRIGVLKSRSLGKNGIEGPYDQYGTLNICDDNQDWEGPCGQVSFFPYQIGDRWYGLYGSNTLGAVRVSEVIPQDDEGDMAFTVGLMQSDRLSGPWHRLPEGNPLQFDPRFIENSIVKKVGDSAYLLFYDGGRKDRISYSFSTDGIHWEPAQHLIMPEDKPLQLGEIRTPLGIVENADNTYDLYFTAYDGYNPEMIPPLYFKGFGYLWKARVSLSSDS